VLPPAAVPLLEPAGVPVFALPEGAVLFPVLPPAAVPLLEPAGVPVFALPDGAVLLPVLPPAVIPLLAPAVVPVFAPPDGAEPVLTVPEGTGLSRSDIFIPSAIGAEVSNAHLTTQDTSIVRASHTILNQNSKNRGIVYPMRHPPQNNNK
jgi:hypothetical protein